MLYLTLVLSFNYMLRSYILPIILEPSSLLHRISRKVKYINYITKEFIKKLIFTMKHHGASGMAAVQVGFLVRIVVINSRFKSLNNSNTTVFINSIITYKSLETCLSKEGCLSFNSININYFYYIKRHVSIKLEYKDLSSIINKIYIDDNTISACVQHEVDHTNGITFLDNIACYLRRSLAMKRYKKLIKKRM